MSKFNNNKLNQFSLNFGPQHPAAHGVLRLALNLNNEVVTKADPHIGLLHRGTEYLITTKPYYLSLPYFDRLDYVSVLLQEHAYCLSIEKTQNINYLDLNIQKTRIIFDELTRVLNHLLAIACHALDVGSMSSIFWSFEERENIMELYEDISGARMHAALYRPIYNNKIIGNFLWNKILSSVQQLPVTLNEINTLLLNNTIWKNRLKNIGLVQKKDIREYNLSGVLARSINCKTDLRLLNQNSYGLYKYIKVNTYTTLNGDSHDRYILRMLEMLESVNIINSVNYTSTNTNRLKRFTLMENTINDFYIWKGFLKNLYCEKMESVESGKGIFSVFTQFGRNSMPLKCKIKSPSYNNLFWLSKNTINLTLTDLITLIGTIDIVFGEIDRLCLTGKNAILFFSKNIFF